MNAYVLGIGMIAIGLFFFTLPKIGFVGISWVVCGTLIMWREWKRK